MGRADVCPVIPTILWVIVALQHRRIVGVRLLCAISPANRNKKGVGLSGALVKHLHMKAYI